MTSNFKKNIYLTNLNLHYYIIIKENNMYHRIIGKI
jgi:hypothetical protein